MQHTMTFENACTIYNLQFFTVCTEFPIHYLWIIIKCKKYLSEKKCNNICKQMISSYKITKVLVWKMTKKNLDYL